MKARTVALPKIEASQVNNNPQEATLFLDSSDSMIKAKVTNAAGSSTVLTLSNEDAPVTSVNGQTGVVDITLQDISNGLMNVDAGEVSIIAETDTTGKDILIRTGEGTTGDGGILSIQGGEGFVNGGNIVIAPGVGGTSSGDIIIKPDVATDAIIVINDNFQLKDNTQLQFVSNDGTISFQKPVTFASDMQYVLPDAIVDGGKLTTDTNGNLSWEVSSGLAQTTDSVTVSGGLSNGMVINFVKTGYQVQMMIEQFSFTGDGNTLDAAFTWPTGMTPYAPGFNDQTFPCFVEDNGAFADGRARLTSSGITFGVGALNTGFTNAAAAGITQITLTYISDDFV